MGRVEYNDDDADMLLARELQLEEEREMLRQHTQAGPEPRRPSNAAIATADIVDETKLAFHLLRTRGLHESVNRGCLRLWDIVQAPQKLDFALISNYMIDLSWLTSAMPGILRCPKVAVIHGDGGIGYRPRNFVFHKPELSEAYGTMHTKMFILGYPKGIRVCVSTANLIDPDYNDKSQVTWVQDFPWKKDVEAAPESSPFEEDLMSYMNAIGWKA